MKTIMAMVNQYGEIVAELKPSGYFYEVPNRELYKVTTMLLEGDEFRVESVEVED